MSPRDVLSQMQSSPALPPVSEQDRHENYEVIEGWHPSKMRLSKHYKTDFSAGSATQSVLA